MRKALCALVALSMLFASALAAEWTYALSPLILRDNARLLTLANRESLLAEDYAPTDLVNVALRRTNPFELRSEAYDALKAMFEAAEAAGHTLYVKSAYRSYSTQKTMYYNRLEKVGRDDGVVAYPGSSDHQTGLGVDILNYEWTEKDGMNEKFALEKEAVWMSEHCHEYGYILRYMDGKQDVTGIMFEPWHFRYVGKDAAAYIMQNALSLEEFTAEWQGAVAAYEAAGGDFDALCDELSAPPPVVLLDEYGEDGDAEVSMFY